MGTAESLASQGVYGIRNAPRVTKSYFKKKKKTPIKNAESASSTQILLSVSLGAVRGPALQSIPDISRIPTLGNFTVFENIHI